MMPAPFTERQRVAERLARELSALGAVVTNVMPLDETHNLRFWCSEYRKREVLQQLHDAGYEPMFKGLIPQVCRDTDSIGMVNSFELALESDRRQLVPDDRPKSERSEPKKLVTEADRMMKHLGLK
jgi:hypothetical protein